MGYPYFRRRFDKKFNNRENNEPSPLEEAKRRYAMAAYTKYKTEDEAVAAFVGESSKGDKGFIVPIPAEKFEEEVYLQTGYKFTGQEIITFDTNENGDTLWLQIQRGVNCAGNIKINDMEWFPERELLPSNIISQDDYKVLLQRAKAEAAKTKKPVAECLVLPKGNMVYAQFREVFQWGMTDGTRWDNVLNKRMPIAHRPAVEFRTPADTTPDNI